MDFLSHKNVNMQATLMTEPEKLTIFERPNFINCCDNNKTKNSKQKNVTYIITYNYEV